MKKRIRIQLLLFIALCFTCYTANSQEVYLASGDYFKKSNCSISFTMGECIVETYIGTSLVLNQGFLQYHNPVATEIKQTDHRNIHLYPNPANSVIHLSGLLVGEKEIKYKLVDLQGRILIEDHILENGIIPVSTQKSGIYFLILTNRNDVLFRQNISIVH